eukprot:242917_1
MSTSQDLIHKMTTISQNMDTMQAELSNCNLKLNNDALCSWKSVVRTKLRAIRNDIHSLDKYAKQLKKEQLCLEGDIKNLNHQMNTLNKQLKLNVKPSARTVHHQHNQIPDWISQNKELQQAIDKGLPSNYNFEIHKMIWRLSRCTPQCQRVGLQFPEGLLMYACVISDILEEFAHVECIILGDVTYGACCIDDYTSSALHCDFLIHFGHSCLVPINAMNDEYYQRILYIFVQININKTHLIETIKLNFAMDRINHSKIVMAGTIQFVHILQNIKNALCSDYGYKSENIIIPQAKPLSPAEVLGCTSPHLAGFEEDTVVLFISDGRFHLESLMIANPQMSYYRYNPYDNKITKEVYDTDLMHKIRYNAIKIAQSKRDHVWCVILSTLGRQGNVNILNRLCSMMERKNIKYVVCLLSEIYGHKLCKFDLNQIQCFVQIGCPRLSIDWGQNIISPDCQIPLLNPYEATVALQQVQWKPIYPMDFYSENGGIWANYYMTEKEKKQKALQRKERRKQLRKQRLLQRKASNHIVVQYQ